MSTKKLSRHDLKKPDEFISIATQAVEWVQANVKTVAAIAAAVVLLAVGVLAFVQQQRGKTDEAYYQWGQAADQLHQAAIGEHGEGEAKDKAIEEALTKLQGVYDAHRGTRAADYALISIGEANFQLRKYEQGANAFESAIAKFDDEPNFKALALVGAGKSWEAMRNFDKALEYYQRANAISGNPYNEVLKGDVGRLKVLKEQMGQLKAASQAAAAAATAPAK